MKDYHPGNLKQAFPIRPYMPLSTNNNAINCTNVNTALVCPWQLLLLIFNKTHVQNSNIYYSKMMFLGLGQVYY
jgi:hypothetical protein